jgi:hypothetical protein
VDETVTYSVMNLEESRSQDSTPSPANLQIMVMQESEPAVAHKEDPDQHQSSGEYDQCGIGHGEEADVPEPADSHEVSSKKKSRLRCRTRGSASGFEDEEYQHIVDMTVPPTPTNAEVSEPCNIPQCVEFGTILPPGKKDPRIVIALEGAELWDQFFQAGTEMIITKSGRYACYCMQDVD